MKRFKVPLGSQSGQAVVEYILLLIVVTLIAGGALYKFSTAFQQFASGYFGNYVACLLESGELPELGEDTGSASTGGSCNDQFKSFSLADGRPANGNGGGSGTSGDGSANGSGRSGQTAASATGGAGSSDSTKIGGLNGSFGRANSRPVSAVEKTAGKEEAAPGDAGVGKGGRSFVKAPLASKEKRTEVQLTGPGSADDDPDDGKHSPKKVASTDESRLKKKKELLVPPRKPAALTDDDKDEGFSFGAFFRWLLIGAMILALVVFLGQQALSISKSQE